MFNQRVFLSFFFCLISSSANSDRKCDFPVYDYTVSDTHHPLVGSLLGLLETKEKFEVWMAEHKKSYHHHHYEEELRRHIIWNAHDEYIECHNSQSSSYKLGHNQFSDLTNKEYRELNNLGKKTSSEIKSILHKEETQKNVLRLGVSKESLSEQRKLQEKSKKKIPTNKDWVTEGAVTPVKDQASCGSCWSFSATGAIEGAIYVKHGKLVSLSEQMLVDCDKKDDGCNGGLMDNAFEFDEAQHGLCSEKNYPYIAETSDCKQDKCHRVKKSKVKSYVDLTEGDQHGLMAAIAMQPISVAMQADQLSFQLYKEGIFDDTNCGMDGDIDHGVLAVGYGHDKESGTDYWLIKNSWGSSWGENGYIRMVRDTPHPYGMCAILRVMSFPVLK